MTETNKQQILIVGCGVFGLSTALHLSSTAELRSKYQVTAIDAHSIPSPLSAATDYNKIIRAEYADFFYSKLSVEALKLWEDDPMYSKEFVQCGRFTLTPKGAAKRAQYEKQGLDNLKKLGYDVNSGIKRIESGEELAETVPEFKDNQFGDDIKGVYNPKAGYGRAARSLVAVYKQCVKQGVVFHFGDDGDAIEILRSSVNGSESVKVQSGKVYNADKIMVCTGASTGKLLDLSTQVKTLGLFVTHIKLTPEEYTKYHNMPIFFSSELGYFFPPDPETLELKIALTYSDTSNKVSDPHNDGKFITLPSYKINNPEHTFLAIDEPKVRHVLRQTIPSLASHQLHDSKICWISDTPKSHFVIDKVPGMKNVFVSTGDAGHAYKFLPNIGKYIKQLLIDGEWETGSELHSKWGWKYGKEAEFPAQFETRAKRLHFDLKDINEIQGGWFEEKEKLNSKL
ncbi:hypothetical protein WICPIJ_006940 [Wickerhamomyces pijperi]|uniref:FAD dependent oxidoreductase domain-containing protein n=1 Tax=Wickerhamomyces pijperi TaxID=599730 RepID=A0A9P8Q139_WICPI|nr:hypothetical protein WICPIJ_006940 [Wickerhamomyces pijperi]